jgi:hypothetical protein
MLDCCHQNHGLAFCNVRVRFRQLDAQAQHAAAELGIVDLSHQSRQCVLVHGAGSGKGQLVVGKQIRAERVEHVMEGIAIHTQLLVHRQLLEQREFGIADIAVGNNGQGNESCRSLRTVLRVFAHGFVLFGSIEIGTGK